MNFSTGLSEAILGAGLFAAPEPFLTKIGGGYLLTDGFIRMASSPIIIYGIWSGESDYINTPHNLLAAVGYAFDQYSASPESRKYQTAFGLAGDFVTGTQALIKNVNKFQSATRTSQKIISGYGIIWNTYKPQYNIYKQYKE
jgi:hypothetical protein